MNKLPEGLQKHRAQQHAGLTLVELLITLGVSTVVVMVAANLVIQSMQSRTSAEELRRKRAEWNLARRFIEAEVTSATRVITELAAVEIPEECGIENDEFTHAIVFPLERPMRVKANASLRENFQILPAAIYGVKSINDGSVINGKALVRCGPRINHDNSYGGFYEADLCADGKDSNCWEVILDNLGSNDECEDGFCVNATECESDVLDRQGLRFYLLANGLSTNSTSSYGQCLGTKSRVAPVYYFPDTRNVCAGEGNINKRDLLYVSKDPSLADDTYGREGERTLRLPQGAIGDDQQVVMCGANFFNIIEGSGQNDIIESENTEDVELYGLDGDDRLLGGNGNDIIEGGAGDDVLIGGAGNDILRGGSGKNIYLVEGDDTIEGSDGVDIIYIKRRKADVNLGDCSQTNCVASDNSSRNGDDPFETNITEGDILFFLDGRKRIK